jgi:hypothetical protein
VRKPYVIWFKAGLIRKNNSFIHASFLNCKVTQIFRVNLLGFLGLNKDCFLERCWSILNGVFLALKTLSLFDIAARKHASRGDRPKEHEYERRYQAK